MNVQFEGNISYADERFNIVITELEAHSICSIDLRIFYSWYEGPLYAYAIFEADDSGVVNFDTMKPIKGCYNAIDSMGLFCGLKYAKGEYCSRKERVLSLK